jgi:hypothetical protein
MIDFVLDPNELTGEPKKFKAQVVNSRSYTFDDIANHLLKHNTGLSGPVIHGVWEGIKDAVKEYVSEGASINTELFYLHPSIQGVFDSLNDGFQRKRHTIRLNLQPGSLFLGIAEKLKARKVNAGVRTCIQSVTDIKSGSVDAMLTPGRNIRILGQRLKIEGPDPSNGLYFEPDDDSGTLVKVEESEFVVNNPSEIVAVIPDLTKGSWRVRVITQFSTGPKPLKTPRKITFDKNLIVA